MDYEVCMCEDIRELENIMICFIELIIFYVLMYVKMNLVFNFVY